jgi:hypothetical protein
VPIGADRAACVDWRPLERDRLLLEKIGRHAQPLGANDAGRDIAGGGAPLLLRHNGPGAQARRERHRCEQECMLIASSAHTRGSMAERWAECTVSLRHRLAAVGGKRSAVGSPQFSPARHGCAVAHSSARRPRRRSCRRPMNHPTMNTAPTKATITPMLTSR